ncbi:hypothetical protein ES703_59596 [subsurface metagenome]
MAKITEYQRGYLDGLKDQPKRRAATMLREIKPELLDYPVAMRGLKTAYASPRDWGETRKFLDEAKKGGCEVVCVAFPEVFGDNYMDVMSLLSLIADYGLHIAVVGKSPFLVKWAENFPIFKVPKK